MAKLTLIPKPGRPPDSPSAFRPICLLDEAGKLFERIVASRLAEHLAQEGPDLSENQYGFQRERSTIDAIESVKSNAQAALRQGGKVLAVSIDIVNAFNSIPWDRIRRALIKHRVPTYLRNIIGSYLSDRAIIYRNEGGIVLKKPVNRRVPQGSVLGPLLWNLGFN